MSKVKDLVVMISGNGTNLQSIINACSNKVINARITSVISNKTGAYGLKRAKKFNIPTCIYPYNKTSDRTFYDKTLANIVNDIDPHYIVLAGWMHILSPAFLDNFPNKVINLHPALPGQFVGMHAIKQAYESYERGEINSTGVMTHYVIPEVDKGDYIQALRVPILDGDSYKDLETRVKTYEKEVLVSTLKMLTQDSISDTETSQLPYPYTKLIDGKVRDVYDIGYDKLAIVHSNRLSSFDRYICDIPEKGQILTATSAFWFNKIEEDLNIKTHYIWSQENVMVVKKCKVFPVEVVVRGYITGSTKTSLWTHYNNGEREYSGLTFPDGLKKNQKLDEIVLTPTTKGDVDEPISAEEIVERGLMTQEQWDEVADKALQIFKHGQAYADTRGLILVDTKYEFGVDSEGNILIIDEVHTCDSSRFWVKSTYETRFNNGESPDKYDKDVVREFIKATYHDPYKCTSFYVPPEHVEKTNKVYNEFYTRLTDNTLNFL